MITYVPDSLWGEMLPIDNAQLIEDCLKVEDWLFANKMLVNKSAVGTAGSQTTASFNNYNLLSFPIESFQILYHKIVSVIKPRLPKEIHIIQCWLNVFRGNEFIDWHNHWDKDHRSIHGFYCVNVTPSFTEYKFKHLPDNIYKVESIEGLLVFGRSNEDIHRSSPWVNASVPRITIAFDIVPISTFPKKFIRPNYYLPF